MSTVEENMHLMQTLDDAWNNQDWDTKGEDIMNDQSQQVETPADKEMRVTVTKNGPYIVSGGVPLVQQEICNDDGGFCRNWKVSKKYSVQETYALCRCGHSQNKPFCDGTHAKIGFDGTEKAGSEPYLKYPLIIKGPELDLLDYEILCVHARFCMRAGGIWDLTENSDDPVSRDTAIEEACNCPSGRLVLKDKKTGITIESDLEKSIVIIEYPARGEHGPLWVRGGIPVVSSDGKPYTVRNRVTLCRCGKSMNKPFCDGSHIQH